MAIGDDFIAFTVPMAVQSPCNLVCTLDKTTGWCLGCGRTGDEIARWTSVTDGERAAVMAALPERMAALEGTAADRQLE